MKNNLAVMGFILLSGLAKLGFHRAHAISSKVPESCLLIILGVIFGGILYLFYEDECSVDQACLDYSHLVFPKFTPDLFPRWMTGLSSHIPNKRNARVKI